MLAEQFEAIQASVEHVRARGICLPVEDVMLFRMLVAIGRSLSQLAEEAIRPFGLTEPEFRVLVELFSKPSSRGHPGELCAGAGQSPASVTRTTDTLVARGLISRAPSEQDRRRMVLRVTAAGETLIHSMLPAAFEHVRTLFASCSSETRQLLLTHLNEIATVLDKADPETLAGGDR